MAGIISSSDGSKKLFLSSNELESLGCRNCVWKNYGQCPEGFIEPEQKVDDGYCMEYGQFILNFGAPADSISAVMEKFLGYTQRIQAMEDGKEYHLALRKFKEFKDNKDHGLSPDEYRKKFKQMELEVISSKVWWSRLTENAIKNLGRIVDRESRSKDVQGQKQLNVQELNIILQDSAKVLLEDKGR